MSQTTVTLTSEIHGFLMATVFILIAIQGYLQTNPFIAGHVYLQLFLGIVPFIIGILKVFAGTAPEGVLSASETKMFYVVAVFLTVAGGTLSGITSDPVYLFVGGLLAAVTAGINGFLGTQPNAPKSA